MSDSFWDKLMGLFGAAVVSMLWLYILAAIAAVVGAVCLAVVGIPALLAFLAGMFLG